jgi:polyhydroxyalkanoate synthase
MQLAPSPRDVVHEDGTAKLYRFPARSGAGPTVLLVPSLINRWYVLDLRKGASLCEALVAEGLDVFVLDWGEPHDEDRFLSWDDVLSRLARMVRRTNALAGSASKLGLLGYCIGGTLSAIHAALRPEGVRALVNLAGPSTSRTRASWAT